MNHKTKKNGKYNEQMRKKHGNYLFIFKRINYSVLGTVKEVLGHDDLQG